MSADTVPTVTRGDDGFIRVADIPLTTHAALTLAHRIADLLTP
jgi:hypothetical protein